MKPFCRDLGPREGRGEVATCEFLPVLSTGDPQEGMGYVAILPRFWPFLIFSLCQALGTPEKAQVMPCPYLGLV